MSSDGTLRLGSYALRRPVGRGGMAEVWEAIDGAGQCVAAKILSAGPRRDLNVIRSVEAELRAMAGLEHPHIVALLDHGIVPTHLEQQTGGALVAGAPFLVMEFCDRGTLAEIAQLEWPQVAGVISALLDALAHAHARGVVHRDLKPANVLLTEDNGCLVVKLTDFGIAHALEGHRDDGVLGTPHFMAPEQFQGAWRDHGPWTDLYALGCLVWSLLTGAPPFSGGSTTALALAHLRDDPPAFAPRVPVPIGVEAWLRRLLCKRLEDRFLFAADADQAIRSVSGLTVEPSLRDSSDYVALREPVTRVFTRTLEYVKSAPQAGPLSVIAGTDITVGSDRAHGGDAAAHQVARTRPLMPAEWRMDDAPAAKPRLGSLFPYRRIPLVGRAAERDLLWNALGAVARTGHCAAILLRGPSGTGKSALTAWLCERAFELGAARVARVAHGPDSGALGSVRGLIASLLRVQRADRDIADRAAAVLARHGGDPADNLALEALVLGDRSSSQVRFASPRERYATAARLLRCVTDDRPLVIVLEDLEFSLDAISLLGHLVGLGDRSPACLIVGTASDEEIVEHPVEWHALTELTSHPAVRRVQLEPLPRDEMRQLVRSLAPQLGDETALLDRAGGNPLFAIELIRGWADAAGTDQTHAMSGSLATLTDVWQERIERALARSRPGWRRALHIAAVLGRDLHLDEWAACLRDVGLDLDVRDNPLLPMRLMEDRGPGQVGFVHNALREALMTDLHAEGRLNACHAVCARALAALHATALPADVAERVGLHLVAAGEPSRAAPLLLEAALARRQSGDLESARRLLVVPVQDGASPSVQVRAWLLQANLLRLEGKMDEAVATTARARSRAAQLGDSPLLAKALISQGRQAVDLGKLDDAAAAFRRAQKLAEDAADPVGVADARVSLAEVLMRKGALSDCEEAFGDALATYQRIGDGRKEIHARLYLGYLATARGALAEAERHYRECLPSARALGDRNLLADTWNGLGELHRITGNAEEAERAYGRAMALYTAAGSVHEAVARVNVALCLLARHDYRSMAPHVAVADQLATQRGQAWLTHTVCILRAVLDADRCAWKECEAALLLALTWFGENRSAYLDDVRATQALADLCARRGNPGLAQRARDHSDALQQVATG